MSYPTDRVMLFDRSMNPLRELTPDEVFSRLRTEEVNGEHSLVIVTVRKLEEGWRALTVDGMGKWREWVVTEVDEDHTSGKTAIGTYRFVWSLQYDLTYSYSHTHAEIGYGTPNSTASKVAEVVLQDVPDWEVGECDAADISSDKGAVMIYESAWSRLSKAVECMECEVDAEIEVSNIYGVQSRKLRLTAHVGSEDVTRRFDWGHDLTDIKRTPDPGPYYCRVVPLGKGETEYAEDDETTFEWPIDITEETGDESLYYIEDEEAAQVFRILKSDGTYYYPTVAVSYDEDDPELLLAAAQADLHNHTRPSVTYEASVVQLARAGMDIRGVSLGDEIQCIDNGFNEDASLRIQGRIVKIEVDELSPETSTQLTIGQLRDDMTSIVASMDAVLDQLVEQHSRVRDSLASMTTTRYIDELLKRINAEINATGGYSYLVNGEGLITYDTAVSDPIIGSEASQVVQIKGGSIRIADSKKDGFSGIDDWDWKTVFTSGHILSDLVTAVKITTGYISDALGNNFWNLDTGEFNLHYFMEIVTQEDAFDVMSHLRINGHDYPSRVYGSERFSCNKNDTFLIYFETSVPLDNSFNVYIGYFDNVPWHPKDLPDYEIRDTAKISEIKYPTLQNKEASKYSYFAKLTSTENRYARIMFEWPLPQTDITNAIHIENFRTYKLPHKTSGVIQFTAEDEDDDVDLETTIMAASVRLANKDVVSELTPGNLMLGTGDFPTTIQMSSRAVISVDPSNNNIDFHIDSSNDPESTSLATSTAGVNTLLGTLSNDGIYLDELPSSEIATSSGDIRLSDMHAYIWGPFVQLYCIATMPDVIEDRHTDQWQDVELGVLKDDVCPVKLTYASGELPYEDMSVGIRIDWDGTMTAYFPPGDYTLHYKKVYFSAIYMRGATRSS